VLTPLARVRYVAGFFDGYNETGSAQTLLIGSGLSFVTPGRSSAVGGVAGAGLDYHVGPNVALFGAVEGTVMSDESRVVSAKGGMRVAF